MSPRFDRRVEPLAGTLAAALFSLAAVAAGLALAGLLFLPFAIAPLDGYRSLVGSAFGNLRGVGHTLVTATPLMLVGFGTLVAWRCGFVFLGFEGCLLVGAAGGTMVGLQALEGGSLAGFPPALAVTLALSCGAMSGALWAGVVGELKVRFGGNEVLMALMMNFLAIYLVQYLVGGPWRVAGDMPQTERLPRELWLPYLLPGTRAHVGILIALGAGALVHVLMERTRVGHEMVTAGTNARAARYGGVDVGARLQQSALVAGGLAGLAGAIGIFGVHHRLLDGLSEGTGFLGIVVALLGRMTVIGTALAACLYGGLSVGGDAMQRQTGLPASIVLIVQSTIVLMLLAGELLRTHRIAWIHTRRGEA